MKKVEFVVSGLPTA